MSCNLKKEPFTVGDTLIANLEHFFPKCYKETARQEIAPFSCCDPARTKMCDFVAQCPFARGAVQHQIVNKSKHKVFVGWGDDFVVVWWTLLPTLTQSRRQVNIETFFAPLLSAGGSQVKGFSDGNANNNDS
jgi:hypothetical protein